MALIGCYYYIRLVLVSLTECLFSFFFFGEICLAERKDLADGENEEEGRRIEEIKIKKKGFLTASWKSRSRGGNRGTNHNAKLQEIVGAA